MSKASKAVGRRLVNEVLNGGRLDLIDELCAPELARAARRWISPFRAALLDSRCTAPSSSGVSVR
jgi:hypothetical protein